MPLKLVSGPAEDAISLEDARTHCRAPDDGSDDVSLATYIAAAISHIDGQKGAIGRALVDQTWDLYLDHFEHRHHWIYDATGLPIYAPYSSRFQHRRQIEIPLPPLIEVTGVYYSDADGNEQIFDPSNYTVDTASEPGRIVLNSGASWPTIIHNANSVRIRFRAGYVDTQASPTGDVPYAIKAALLLVTGTLYDNRESVIMTTRGVAELPFGVAQLLRNYDVRVPFA